MPKTVLVPYADGTEEIESSAIYDVLKRAGMNVLAIACADKRELTLSQGFPVRLPHTLKEYIAQHYGGSAEKFAGALDAVVIPGGQPGADNLSKSAELKAVVEQLAKNKKLVAAMCASPVEVLGVWGYVSSKSAITCYPAMKDMLAKYGAKWSEKKVVYDQAARILTSQGPGTAIGYALAAVALLESHEVAKQINAGLLTNWETEIDSMPKQL